MYFYSCLCIYRCMDVYLICMYMSRLLYMNICALIDEGSLLSFSVKGFSGSFADLI